jgi:ankyrin repeat protein
LRQAAKLDKSTALHDAVSGGHLDCAKLLLERMEDHMQRKEILGLVDDRKRTLLHTAAKRGQANILERQYPVT